jgi:hypothetical protein
MARARENSQISFLLVNSSLTASMLFSKTPEEQIEVETGILENMGEKKTTRISLQDVVIACISIGVSSESRRNNLSSRVCCPEFSITDKSISKIPIPVALSSPA